MCIVTASLSFILLANGTASFSLQIASDKHNSIEVRGNAIINLKLGISNQLFLHKAVLFADEFDLQPWVRSLLRNHVSHKLLAKLTAVKRYNFRISEFLVLHMLEVDRPEPDYRLFLSKVIASNEDGIVPYAILALHQNVSELNTFETLMFTSIAVFGHIESRIAAIYALSFDNIAWTLVMQSSKSVLRSKLGESSTNYVLLSLSYWGQDCWPAIPEILPLIYSDISSIQCNSLDLLGDLEKNALIVMPFMVPLILSKDASVRNLTINSISRILMSYYFGVRQHRFRPDP